MTFDVVHRTLYRYSQPVTVSQHTARVEPRSLPGQIVEDFSLRIEPAPPVRKTRGDYFGNRVCFFSIQEVHSRLEIIAKSRLTIAAVTPPVLSLSPPWEKVVQLFSDPVSPEVVEPYEFVFDSPLLRADEKLAAYARASFTPGAPLLSSVLDLNRRIYTDFKYDKVATTVATPLEEVMEKRRGVCQDFAHLAIACLRSMGLAARYVSGYLRTCPPEGKVALAGAPTPPMPGFPSFAPNWDGWISTQPTTSCPKPITSRWVSGAISAMSAPSAAS